MKVLSFNTYLAPSIPDRFSRKNHILKKINNWMNEGIDVICLQEMNDFTLGLFGFIYYNYNLFNYCNIFLQRFFDLLFILEGSILPMFFYNNSIQLKKNIDIFNLSTDKKYFFLVSKPLYRGLSGGLVIITLHEPILDKTYYLKSDSVHCPNVLYTKLRNLNDNSIFTLVNLHLIPKLVNYTCLYKSVNILNYINYINVYNLQKNNIENLKHIIFENIKKKSDMKQSIFIAGDFNIKKNKQIELYNYLIKNIKLIGLEDNIESYSKNYLCSIHFLGMEDGQNSCEIDQIDYIFSNIKSTNFDRLLDCFYLSDHYPIISEFN